MIRNILASGPYCSFSIINICFEINMYILGGSCVCDTHIELLGIQDLIPGHSSRSTVTEA